MQEAYDIFSGVIILTLLTLVIRAHARLDAADIEYGKRFFRITETVELERAERGKLRRRLAQLETKVSKAIRSDEVEH